MEACGWRDLIPAGACVAVKPNLCTERPEQIHTANTSAEVLRAVCQVLRERTDRVTVVESDGARYKAETAFENNGVYRIADELGLKVVNLSNDELVEVDDPRMKGFGLARTWLEADAFITLPVLKTHATTVFTGAIKNQWGCVPRYDRILLHKYLHELVGDLNKLRPVTFGLMDGLVGMQGRGPINGYPINRHVLLASRDPVALDATGMRLIGLDPDTSAHIVHGQPDRAGTDRRRPDRGGWPVRRVDRTGRAGRRGLGDQADEQGRPVGVPDSQLHAQRPGVLPAPQGGRRCPPVEELGPLTDSLHRLSSHSHRVTHSEALHVAPR